MAQSQTSEGDTRLGEGPGKRVDRGEKPIMSLVCTLMHPFIGAVNILSVLPIKRKKK